jgi:hypothetical protein
VTGMDETHHKEWSVPDMGLGEVEHQDRRRGPNRRPNVAAHL